MKNTGAGADGGRRRSEKDMDDVERLLQSAQDELILKMSVDSHMSHASPNLDPDLHRRFQALRSQPSSSVTPPIPKDLKPKSSPVPVDGELKAVLGDDLSARFAALKSSIAHPAPTGEAATAFDFGEDDDEEDEVEKLIQWAKDAARLDPSPPSHSDVEDNEDRSDESPGTSSDEDEGSEYQKKKKDPTKSNSRK